jgi:hypothetical protein
MAAKKATKKTIKGTKRAYNRRPKVEDTGSNLPLVIGPIPGYDGSFARDEQAVLSETPPTTLQSVQAIEAIDMRPLSVEDRFAVLVMLNQAGYLASDGQNLLTSMEHLMVALQVDVLALQHTNRLVSPKFIHEVVNTRFISVPSVQIQGHVQFSYPRSGAPDEVVIGGEVYERRGAYPF